MVALLDARPPGLDILYRPDNTLTVELTWPTGELTGRTFTSDLGGTALALAVLGDVMTIVASDDVTAAQTAAAAWRLVETTGGESEVVLQGVWTPSTSPQATTAASLEVTDGEVAVDVTVVSGQASIVALDAGLTAHEAAETAHGWTLAADGTTIVWDGAIHTDHDARYFYPADMVGTAQLVSSAGTLQAPPYWAFDQSTVERVKWLWTPGDAWESYVVRLGWINTGFGAGNVRWRYYERRTVVNAGQPLGNWVATPTQVAEITSAAPQLDGNRYEDLAVDVPVTPLTVVMSIVERITSGVPSNLAADAGLYIATATRT